MTPYQLRQRDRDAAWVARRKKLLAKMQPKWDFGDWRQELINTIAMWKVEIDHPQRLDKDHAKEMHDAYRRQLYVIDHPSVRFSLKETGLRGVRCPKFVDSDEMLYLLKY